MKGSKYVSRQPDDNGVIHWTDEENSIWQDLITNQLKLVEGRACNEFMQGLDMLNLPTDRIPQFAEIDKVLMAKTGWRCAGVPCLINFDRFFTLLANKEFPVATFIRSREDFYYVQEPDIFHEVFGHTVMLTNPAFANFTEAYGKIALAASEKDRVWLARLYWFTVEFGLVQQTDGVRIYGGGILSSPSETKNSLDSNEPERLPFEPVEILRTPYRIDMEQKAYFVIESIDKLFDTASLDLMAMVEQAQELGLLPSRFPPKAAIAS